MPPLKRKSKVFQQIRVATIGCWDASATLAQSIPIIGVVAERNWHVETRLPFIQLEAGGKRNQIWPGTTDRLGTRCVCPSARPLEPSIFTRPSKQQLRQPSKSKSNPTGLSQPRYQPRE